MSKKDREKETTLSQIVPWIVASGIGILNLIAFGDLIPPESSGNPHVILELSKIFATAADAGVPIATLVGLVTLFNEKKQPS